MADSRHEERIRSLATAARTLGRSAQLVAMVEIAAEAALEALKAASVSISRLEPGTGTLRTLINVGSLGPEEERWPEQEVYHLDDFLQLQAVVGELRVWIITVDDPFADPGELKLLTSLAKGSSMGAPLVVDGKLWGELYATRAVSEQSFSAGDVAYTEALAAILAGAVSRALHVDTLERMAFVDPLTGLANRRALDDAALSAFDVISERAGRRVSAVAVDLNGLKEVNDQGGHPEGDRLLSLVAALLQQHFSALHGSLVARVGGDEFTVLVPGHDVDAVVEAATAACNAASSLPLGAGLSCGVATVTSDSVQYSARELFRAADAAQYDAKRDGFLSPRQAGQDGSG